MWGELWGSMVWGGGAGPIQQVPIAPWALVFLGVLLGISLVRAQTSRAARVLPLTVALLVPVLVVSRPTLTIFENGTIADAGEVNENFATLAAQTRITRSIWVDANGIEVGPNGPDYLSGLGAVLIDNGEQSGVALIEAVDAAGISQLDPSSGAPSTNRFLVDVEFFAQTGCTGARVAAFPETYGFSDTDFTGLLEKYSDGNWYRWSEPRILVTIRSVRVFDYSIAGFTCTNLEVSPTLGWTLEEFDFSDAALTPPFRRRPSFAGAD